VSGLKNVNLKLPDTGLVVVKGKSGSVKQRFYFMKNSNLKFI
jgi:excinuclease UvrABC ATPase subunit